MSTSFLNAVETAAAARPEARFIARSSERPADNRLADILASGKRVGAGFRSIGIKRGDVIAAMLPAWESWLTTFIGAAYAGAVFLPIVTIYRSRDLRFVLRQSKAKLIVAPDDHRGTEYADLISECGDLPDLKYRFYDTGSVNARDAFQHLDADPVNWPSVPTAEDEFAFLVYTSGTTSHPKGVKHSSATLLTDVHSMAEARGRSHDVILSPWPPGHVAGALQMLRFLTLGNDLITMDQWDAGSAATLISDHKVTSSSGTPFHMSGLIEAADRQHADLSSLKSYILGAAPVPASLVQSCIDRKITVVHAYGSSEHPTVTMGADSDSLESRLHTEGRVMPGSEIRIVDETDRDLPAGEEGEIVTRGPELFLGYLDQSLDDDAFLPGGWYRTGDIGHLDAEGFLCITDRKKDIIIRGGENISSREVEDAMRSMPGVRDAAAIAIPDPRFGERVKVILEMTSERSPSLDYIRAHFLSLGLAKQKIPEALSVVSALPRNATGKVLKSELRKMELVS